MFNKRILLVWIYISFFSLNCFAASVKRSEFDGQFYPAPKKELSEMIDVFLDKAEPQAVFGGIAMLISPHAGYGFSGQTAAFGYKLIKNRNYKTVIILGASHHKQFNGAAVYGPGVFVTSLGQVNVDYDFIKLLLDKDPELFLDEEAFINEHSIEVQLPFLQKVVTGFSIVPVVIGDCSLEGCKKIALLFKEAIGQRKDVLVIVSTDLYHGYDYQEADLVDGVTLNLIKKLDDQGLYYALRDGNAQACGGMATVVALALAKELGYQKLELLNHTNSGKVTGKLQKGDWTVGYASCVIIDQEGENMLTVQQKQKLLKFARQSIMNYLQTGKKMPIDESDPVLIRESGVFVTLNQHDELRGCIGNLVASQPLYLAVRDMAIEAAVDDPRFPALGLNELKEVQIDISVLSSLERVFSVDKIELGKHGVLVRRGSRSGVFLPQVATETGWSKEEFLDNLCAHKAGISSDAWKDKDTEIYIFTADVFSEKEIKE